MHLDNIAVRMVMTVTANKESNKKILEVQGVSKEYPGVKALDNVDFDLFCGEVHVLIGENGAGKSTFTQILVGAVQKDEGHILVDGQTVDIPSPLAGKRLGISMVFQESHLAPFLSVAENIFLGDHATSKIIKRIKWKETNKRAQAVLQRLNCDINPKALAGSLSVAERRMVEIAKAISTQAKIVILDEPTASLNAKETEALFNVIKSLKSEGVGVIYISHRLGEIEQIGDRVTVFRDGRRIDTLMAKEASVNQLIEMMVGRAVESSYPWEAREHGEVMLAVESICSKSFKDISFELRVGEILGLSGLEGSGNAEVVRALFGDIVLTSGRILVEGSPCKFRIPRDAVRQGIAYIPSDRRREGFNINMDIVKNTTLASLRQFLKGFLLSGKKELAAAAEYKEKLNIITPTLSKMVYQLSGGNQQKVVLAKWLCSKAKIIIFHEPTHGIDVGVKYEFHQLITTLAKSGTAVILLSSDLPEIIGMSDRILIMRSGEIVAEFSHEEATQEAILSYST